MRLIYATALFLGMFNHASADLLVKSPAQACILLNDVGLTTGDWKNDYEQEYGCFSSYKQIGSAFPLANNLAIYFEGNSSTVTLGYLMLNVNDKPTANTAHKELLRAANVLVTKQAGKPLSKKLTDAITKGSNASEKIGNSMVDVLREDWPTGRGYEVKLTIK
jgi:hypothetical protein